MKPNSDPVPLRNQLLTWTKSAGAAQKLRSEVERADPGSSTNNPVELPSNLAQRPAGERCEWALRQLAEERLAAARARDEQARGAALREKLEKLQGQKRSQESARARKRFLQLAAVLIVLVLIVGGAGILWLQHRPPSISTSAAEDGVKRALGARGFSLSSMTMDVGAVRDGVAPVRAIITAKLDQPLFAVAPPEPVVQGEYKLDPRISRRIAELTSGKGAARLLELAGLSGGAADATKVTLLKIAKPAGTVVTGSASWRASRSGSGDWVLSEPMVALPPLAPDGKPRQAFSGPVFELERAEDRARLRTLIEDQPNVMAKLERAREAFAAEGLALHRKEEESLRGIFRPGAIFSGTVAGRTPTDKKAVFFEVTEATAGQGAYKLKTLFHNDGGWGDGRGFEGTWQFDAVDDRFELSLASGSDQAIRGAGPVVGDAKLVKIQFGIQADRLTGDLDGAACQMARVPDADAERIKREASPDYFGLRDAMAPDSLYVGTVKIGANTQRLFLRFTRVESGGAVVEAVIQDPERAASQYKLTGALIGNRYREAQWPLRLAVVRTAIPPGIPASSVVLQFPALVVRLENGRLLSDYRGQPFPFERLGPEETAQRLQKDVVRRRTFDTAMQPGKVLDGVTINPQKTARSIVRLRVLTLNPADGSITARLDSGQTPGLFRNLVGKVFAEAGILNLAFDVRANEYSIDRRAPEPFFKGGRDNLILTLEGAQLTGQDGHMWTFEFNL